MKKKHLLDSVQGRVLMCDGAMGTMLQAEGLSAGECPEYWNLTKPDIVTGIHKKYIDAGSDMILSNTFGANRMKLEKFNLDGKLKEINAAGIKNAKKAAAKGPVYVGGDIGPTGQMLEPYGFMTDGKAFETFAEQSEILAGAGADFIIVETMIAIEETVLAVKAAKSTTKLPILALMTFNINNGDVRTVMGVDTETMAKQLEDAGADIIGANCGYGIDSMIDIVREIKKRTNRFIIAEPNAGLPVMKEGVVTYDGSPELMASRVIELIEAGANIIGGCCGTTPDHIAQMKKMVERRNSK